MVEIDQGIGQNIDQKIGQKISVEEVIDRARAAFLGLALGDALGATTEFMLPREIKAKHGTHNKIIGGGWLYLKSGSVTDDTEMSLAIARAIIADGGWNLTTAADNLVGWMRNKPIDIGATCRKGLRNYMLKGVLETPVNDWDAGNGAVMRMAPTAIFSFGDDELMQRSSLEQARLTHNHRFSDAACITVGRMVHDAMAGADRFALHRRTQELKAEYPKFDFNNYKGDASGYVVDTIKTVFHYLFTTATFEECLVGVVNQGGDADTTGAIAGLIAGAFYGLEALPKRWLKRLDKQVYAEVDRVAVELVKCSPWYQAGSRSEG